MSFERKVFDCVMRTCPACGGGNVEFRLEDREIPYGGNPGVSPVDNPDQQWLKCHAIVEHCNDCTEEFLGWQSDAIVDAAVLVYKESLPAAAPPEPMWTPEKMQREIEKSKADCAKDKHWLGLNPDLTPSTRCAWDFCDYGKTT